MSIQAASYSRQSSAYAIRSKLVFGLSLCAMSRTESRFGSACRAEQLVRKAKRVVEDTLRDLHYATQIEAAEKRHLGMLAEQLRASIGGLDPLWVPVSDGPGTVAA